MEEALRKATDGLVARYINRRLSNPITLAIVRHGALLTPNQVSVISLLIGLASAATYILKLPVLAGVLIQVSSIVDGVDGELARLLGMESRRGAFLDAVLDRFVDISVIIGLTLYVNYCMGLSTYVFLASMAALSGCLMVSYIHARGEASLGVHPSKLGRVFNFSSRDVRLFAMFLGSVLGLYVETLLFIALLSYTYVIAKFVDTLAALPRSASGGGGGCVAG